VAFLPLPTGVKPAINTILKSIRTQLIINFMSHLTLHNLYSLKSNTKQPISSQNTNTTHICGFHESKCIFQKMNLPTEIWGQWLGYCI
jgi:hypothetical protein